jgi:hypothetical protein
MGKAVAIMVGIILGGHGLIGLFIEGTHFLIFNVDFILDITYLASAAILLFVGLAPVGGAVIRGSMLLVTAVLGLLGLWGLSDDHLGGLAPTGLTIMDLAALFGLALGTLIGALWGRITEPIENFA